MQFISEGSEEIGYLFEEPDLGFILVALVLCLCNFGALLDFGSHFHKVRVGSLECLVESDVLESLFANLLAILVAQEIKDVLLGGNGLAFLVFIGRLASFLG